MASGIFNRFKANLFKGLVDVAGSGSHTVNVGLVVNTYTFNADHNVWTEISTLHEASGSGYTTNGQALANKSVTQNNGSDLAYFDADDTTWAASTITARFAIVYDATLITKDLIACYDFGSDQSSSSGNFTIQWNASGLIQLA